MVGVTVDTYAMVGVSVDSGYQRSENAHSENTSGAQICAYKLLSVF